MSGLKGYLRAVELESTPCCCGHLRRQHDQGVTLTNRRAGGPRRTVGACTQCACSRFRYRKYAQ
jgi:hypothetical protein